MIFPFCDKSRPLLAILNQNLQEGFGLKAEKLLISREVCWTFPDGTTILTRCACCQQWYFSFWVTYKQRTRSKTEDLCNVRRIILEFASLTVVCLEHSTLLLFIFKGKIYICTLKFSCFLFKMLGSGPSDARPWLRCQVISLTCHYILSRLLNPLMQSAVVCVSIYMLLFYPRVSVGCTYWASWQVLISFQNWAPGSHEMLQKQTP